MHDLWITSARIARIPVSNYIFLCLHFEFDIQSSFSQMTFFSSMCCHYIKLPGFKLNERIKKNNTNDISRIEPKRWKASNNVAKSLFIHSFTICCKKYNHRMRFMHIFNIVTSFHSIYLILGAKPSLVAHH